jgi:predicted lipid-binding transport protein (Tim44 family)
VAADLLIYAIIAAGLVFWLRSILGTRTGDERQRPNPFTQARPGEKTPLTAVPTDAEAAAGVLPGYYEQAAETLDRNMAVNGPDAEQGLAAIAAADRDFSTPHFLRGAQDAFIMIVEAFARADRETLRDLLHPAVYANFDAALQQREKDGETASVEIHAIRKVEVESASLEGRTASVTVRFVADETSVLRDKDGKLLSGHPDRVTETIDIWTFRRDIKSGDLSWLLCETREGAGDAQKGSTVPDNGGITV